MELKPITFSGGLKSISDDDLCSGCKNCEYRPGEMSFCGLGWPGQEDGDGYVRECAAREPSSSGEVIYVFGDDPMSCPRCGSRTDFTEPEHNRQHHCCLNSSCGFKFVAEPDVE